MNSNIGKFSVCYYKSLRYTHSLIVNDDIMSHMQVETLQAAVNILSKAIIVPLLNRKLHVYPLLSSLIPRPHMHAMGLKPGTSHNFTKKNFRFTFATEDLLYFL